MAPRLAPYILLAALLLFQGSISAQVTLKSGSKVYFGSEINTTAPASITESKVLEATPEYQRIKREGIKEGSAQYKLLESSARDRIRKAIRDVAIIKQKDLVTRDTDIEDNKGKTVTDITSDVIESMSQQAS